MGIPECENYKNVIVVVFIHASTIQLDHFLKIQISKINILYL